VLFETARAPVERGLLDLRGELEQRGADDSQITADVVDVEDFRQATHRDRVLGAFG
jgi:hypothetical protein